MRNPTLLPTLILGALAAASLSTAEPIRIQLADVGAGGIGPREFVLDMERQPDPPFDFPDVNELTGDYILKREDYRINIADYFHVAADGWSGYGFNWLLERWPRDIGIFEQYCQIVLFSAPGTMLSVYGPWTTGWEAGTELGGTLETPSGTVVSPLRIVSLGDDPEVPAVPEPGTLALFALGIASLAGLRLRKPAPSRPAAA